MKKLALLLMLVLSAGIFMTACSDDKDEPVQMTELPQTAQNFLSTYFGKDKIVSAEKDTDGGRVTYDVHLNSGFEIEFDQNGEWTDVDAPYGKVIPSGIVPEVIANYIEVQCPGVGINEISRDSLGYEVKLVNGTELRFKPDGSPVIYS